MFEALRAPRSRIAGLSLDRPRIMGVVNVTPDSFSDGGQLATAQAAIDHAFRLEEEGADILDIGAESTRPGAEPVQVSEELGRLMPVIEGLAGKTEALISVDTRNAETMRAVAAAGADLINDVSALSHDPAAFETLADIGLPVVLMHAQGDPRTMQDNPVYDDVLLDVFDYLEARIEAAGRAGIPKAKLIVDPGIGFGKTLDHNLALMAGLSLLQGLGVPVLLGASRKRFIGTLTGVERASDRVMGSIGAALAAVAQGAQIVRVHDVAATRAALTVWEASMRGVSSQTDRLGPNP
jgi:dihydropteroate synthase